MRKLHFVPNLSGLWRYQLGRKDEFGDLKSMALFSDTKLFIDELARKEIGHRRGDRWGIFIEVSNRPIKHGQRLIVAKRRPRFTTYRVPTQPRRMASFCNPMLRRVLKLKAPPKSLYFRVVTLNEKAR